MFGLRRKRDVRDAIVRWRCQGDVFGNVPNGSICGGACGATTEEPGHDGVEAVGKNAGALDLFVASLS